MDREPERKLFEQEADSEAGSTAGPAPEEGAVAARLRCYCGAEGRGALPALRAAGWRWLASWYGWTCPACAPRLLRRVVDAHVNPAATEAHLRLECGHELLVRRRPGAAAPRMPEIGDEVVCDRCR